MLEGDAEARGGARVGEDAEAGAAVVVEAGTEGDCSACAGGARHRGIFDHAPEGIRRDRRRPERRMLIRRERNVPQPLAGRAVSAREHREVRPRLRMLFGQRLDSGDQLPPHTRSNELRAQTSVGSSRAANARGKRTGVPTTTEPTNKPMTMVSKPTP